MLGRDGVHFPSVNFRSCPFANLHVAVRVSGTTIPQICNFTESYCYSLSFHFDAVAV